MDWGNVIGCIIYIMVPLTILVVMMSGKGDDVDGIIAMALAREEEARNVDEE
jgi:hypothetical protein